jgi:hypothetical protein
MGCTNALLIKLAIQLQPVKTLCFMLPRNEFNDVAVVGHPMCCYFHIPCCCQLIRFAVTPATLGTGALFATVTSQADQ